tara:strand:- start:4 stop:711 length:708 start_codon:yes stop_codon:yes gene_type:complete
MKKPTGYIIYEGSAVYDGMPIVMIATRETANNKTGDMWQTWIMRSDIEPHTAVKSGDDFSVCGNCPLRPIHYKKFKVKKPCYVVVWQAPLSVYRKYKRGGYEYITLAEFRKMLQNGAIRQGSYGDPSTIPYEVWEAIGIGSGEFNHTGYTHGYLLPNFDTRNLNINMVSLDPVTEQIPEYLVGRSFRAIESVDQVRAGEILCPASKEQNYKTQCAKCGLCKGKSIKAKNIAIVMH